MQHASLGSKPAATPSSSGGSSSSIPKLLLRLQQSSNPEKHNVFLAIKRLAQAADSPLELRFICPSACSCLLLLNPRSPSDVACLARGQIVKLLAPHIKKCVRALARHNAQPGTVLPKAPLAEVQCLQHCMRILCCFFEGLRESKEGNVHAFFELGEIPLSRSQCESFSLI
jgi:hypothetical protein